MIALALFLFRMELRYIYYQADELCRDLSIAPVEHPFAMLVDYQTASTDAI
jgi:hypothetical protein